MRDSTPRDQIEWFPPPTLPRVGEGPKEAESRYRRIPPTTVCRDEVGLTSWLGKPLHLPAHREQARVLRHPLEFRKLPCIRGCRLTGLVASSGCRIEGGVEPLREKRARRREGGPAGVGGRDVSDGPGAWSPLSKMGRAGEGKIGTQAHAPTLRVGFVEFEGSWRSRRPWSTCECLSCEPSSIRAYHMQLS